MPSEQIDAGSRQAFLDGFAGQHRGWLITVERVDRVGNREILIDGLPLRSVGTDGAAVTIAAGTDDDEERVRVDGVTGVVVERVERDAISMLRFVTPSGETILRFRTVISPELVDGVA